MSNKAFVVCALLALSVSGCGGFESAADPDLRVGALVSAGDPTPALFTINEELRTLVRIHQDGSWDYRKLGGDPGSLTVASDGRTLLALDQASSEVIVLDANNSELEPIRLPAGQGHNQIIVSPNQPYAVTFLKLAENDDVVFDGTLSLNEIRVIDLTTNPPVSIPVIVAFNPRDVVFSPEGDLAVVVSERRASFVPLASPPEEPEAVRLDLSTTEVAPPEAVIVRPRQTQAADDLTYALIARRGSGEMFAVAIENGAGAINVVDVGIVPTDLVVTPDGQFAVAVSRGRDLAAVIRLDPFGAFDTADVYLVSLPEAVGDVAVAPPDGDPEHDRRVLLYDAYGNLEELMVLDTETLQARRIPLVNPPTEIIPGPAGLAIALHKRYPTSPSYSEVDAFFDNHDSFSLVDLDKRTASPTAVEALPTDGLFAPSAGLNRAFVTVPGSNHLAVIDTSTGTAGAIKIARQPERIGAMPDGTIYTVHGHAFGAISFVNPADLTTVTARGFMAAGALD